IPKPLSSAYSQLTNSTCNSRPSPNDIVTRCRSAGGFLKNSFVDTMLFIEEIQIKDSTAKNRFFAGLPALMDNFPPNVCKYKILPQLINSFEFGDAGSSVLTPLFKVLTDEEIVRQVLEPDSESDSEDDAPAIVRPSNAELTQALMIGRMLDADEYQKKIVPCVVKLFSSKDRATRARLLQQVDQFMDHLSPEVVNQEVFPHVVQGFSDTNPTIREQTVKAMVHMAPKLNYHNLNEEGGIRTNTTVCLGKIACHLHPQYKPPPPQSNQVARDLAFRPAHGALGLPGPPAPVMTAAAVAPPPAVAPSAYRWPLHPAAIQPSYHRDLLCGPARSATPAAQIGFPTSQWQQQPNARHAQCQRCGGVGHAARNCATGRRFGPPLCFRCQQPGHFQAQCPGNGNW
ncbi:hypothetical protein HPB47_013493, partial [Ixodes persulcatus]